MYLRLSLLLRVLALVLCCLPAGQAFAARKALVIGNANYLQDGKVEKVLSLPRSKADAEGVAATLAELGFARQHISLVLNADNKAMTEAIEAFAKTIVKDDEVVFYFSGHGISTDSGGNFLVPTDGPALDLDASDLALVSHYKSLDLTLRALQQRQPAVVIAILDACRSYPTRQFNKKNGLSVVTGMNTQYQPAEGQLIMYAASHGRSAQSFLDKVQDTSPYSVYTRVLLEEMKRPAEHVVNMAQRVNSRVKAMTAQGSAGGAQQPEFQTKLYGNFSFTGAQALVAAKPVGSDADKDGEIARLRAQLAARPAAVPDGPIVVPARPAVGIDDGPIIAYPDLEGFVILKGGVARDKVTGLEWMRCALGQTWNGSTCQGNAKAYSFDAAQQAAQERNSQGGFAGKNDWRVPSARELFSLVRCSKGIGKYETDLQDKGAKVRDGCLGDGYARPTLAQAVFPNTPGSWFWSSSPYVGDAYSAWVVSFDYGVVNDGDRNSSVYVRLVRAGQ